MILDPDVPGARVLLPCGALVWALLTAGEGCVASGLSGLPSFSLQTLHSPSRTAGRAWSLRKWSSPRETGYGHLGWRVEGSLRPMTAFLSCFPLIDLHGNFKLSALIGGAVV